MGILLFVLAIPVAYMGVETWNHALSVMHQILAAVFLIGDEGAAD
jgi:hypothetical protein